MEIKEFKPKSCQLKSYIKSIYFLQSNSNSTTEFVYYPHVIDTVNIFFKSSVSVHKNLFTLREHTSSNEIILSASKTKFRKAIISGKYDIIGINFYPLAFHNFFSLSNLELIEEGDFKLHTIKELESIGALPHINERIKGVEQFLMKKFQKRKFDKLLDIVSHIHQQSGSTSMQELEIKAKLNRRTILRMFKKYLFCSFEDYKNIVRFRLIIENIKSGNEKGKDLMNGIPYYDQSHFIHSFSKLTGETPKKLLQHFNSNPIDNQYFWKLIRK